MEVINLPVERLRAADWNPNQLDPPGFAKLKHSLSIFGLVAPLVARPLSSGSYEVLSGNQRLLALEELGFTSVPCVVVDLDDARARLLAQTLNRLQGVDDPGLKVELLRDLLVQLPQEDILAVLPESAESLAALGSLGQQDLAEALQKWDRAKQARLHHLTFQLANSQLETLEQALAAALTELRDSDSNNPNPRGNALYRICQWYLKSNHSEPEEDSHDQGND